MFDFILCALLLTCLKCLWPGSCHDVREEIASMLALRKMPTANQQRCTQGWLWMLRTSRDLAERDADLLKLSSWGSAEVLGEAQKGRALHMEQSRLMQEAMRSRAGAGIWK